MNAPYGPPQPGPYGPPPQGPYGARPPYGPPYQPPQPPPPPRKSNTGKILLIVLGVFVVLIVAAVVAVSVLIGNVANKVGNIAGGTGVGCDAVATDDGNAALGGTYDVIQLGGGIGAMAAPALDSRVLADAPTCWAVESGNGSGKLARIARYTGGDAAARFAKEKTAAHGTTQDRGNGLSVSTEGYFGGDVAAGDEAFCTSGDVLGSAGALVRRGDTLIYVSTTAAGDGAASPPQLGVGADGTMTFATDKANCDKAVALAAKVKQ